MDRTQFNEEAGRVFSGLVRVFDELDPDVVEAERSGGILKLIFHDGVQFILNTQSAAHQIWLAGASRGWHFDYSEELQSWVCPKTGDELYSTLESMVSAKLGDSLSLR